MDLKTVVNTLFQNKRDWPKLTDEDKETFFFIVNRYMAKKHPLSAQKFNKKGVDKAVAMDIWFETFKRELRTPGWFWAGGKTLRKKTPAEALGATIAEHHGMRLEDAVFLANLYPEDVKAEAKRLEAIQKEKDK